MEIKYKRELKHNYLIIIPEETFYDSYETVSYTHLTLPTTSRV